MASLDSPQTWAPYYNSKDCSQGFCTLYCPQWCYVIFPPPPPLPSGFPIEESNLNFSPLVIALIGILATVFLLISYYIVVSKYCRNLDALRGRLQQDPNEELDDGRDPFYHAAWQIATTGLDESLIKSIAVCKYKKGDGFVEGSDCAVCLNEFREDETLRLLPKCSHAFHLVCIDTWLRSHSNCPLCRASINSTCPMPRQSSSQPPESSSDHGPSTEIQSSNNEIVVNDDLERGGRELHILTNLGRMEPRDAIIEIEDDEIRPIRTTASIGSSCQCKFTGKEDDFLVNDGQIVAPVGSITKRFRGEITKPCKSSSALHCIMSPVSMKRSSSSKRVLFLRHGRRNLVSGKGLGWYTTGPFINRSSKSGSGPTHILIDPEILSKV